MKKLSIFLMLMAFFAPLALNAQSRSTLTVYGDNTTTNEYVPIYGFYCDEKSKCEFIIPAEKLNAMNGGIVSDMKFYLSSSNSSNDISATFNVFVKEVSATTLTGFTGTTNATTVYNSTISIPKSQSNMVLDIPFSSNYVYGGGNLLIGVYQTGNSSYNHTYWTGENQSGNTAWQGYGSGSGSGRTFLPKTTFTYEISTTPSIILPATATVLTGFTTTLTATTLNVTGTPSITYSSSNTSVATVTGSGTTATVTGVAPGTATITATMTYNSNTYTSTCAVTVENPSYCTPGTGNYDNDGISNVTFGTNGVVVNNTVSGIDYGDYSNLVGAVEAGTTSFEVAITYKTSYTYGTIIWVDWDNSYSFEGTEVVYAGQSGSSNPTTLTATFDIPSTALGDYRMRIIGADMALDSYTSSLSAAANADPCGSYNYSTCHDYTLRVNAAASCPKPTALNVTNLTPNSAWLNWTGTSDSYTVRYRKAEYSELAEDAFFDDFENGLGNWTLIVNAEGTGWQTFDATQFTGGTNHSGSYVAMARSYEGGVDITADNWMISSRFTSIPNTMTYWAKNDGRDDHLYDETYDVCVSTSSNSTGDFQIVQTFTTTPDTWQQITIDLSAYAGAGGYIAFHHHDAEKDMLLIDDVLIGNVETTPAGEWHELPPTTNNYVELIEVLDDDTEYEYQVMANCEGENSGWTDINNFHTPSLCSVTPTGLTADVTGNSAELSWTGNADTYDIQYREVDPTAPVTIILNVPTDIWEDGTGYQMLLDADATAYGDVFTATGGWSATDYSAFEYLIPTDAECSADATHIVLENSVSIQIPAGTYDWCIVNPSPADSKIYIAASNGNVGGRQDDYVFESGMTYEFTPSIYGTNDGIDVTITDNNTWTLVEGVTNPYTLQNLKSTTMYEWQVQGVDCDGNGNNTDWSASASFTTPEFYTKTIEAYEGDGGYYLIASPLANNVAPTDVVGMITDNLGANVDETTSTYDLYSFDQAQELEWRNYRASNFSLVNGQGYLYASKEGTELVFTGAGNTGNTQDVTLYMTDAATGLDFPDWNLVGNPFAKDNAYLSDGRAFYSMQNSGVYTPQLGPVTIGPMEGVFVVANSNEETLTFTTTQPNKKVAQLTLNLTKSASAGSTLLDRAIVSFGEGSQLPKLQFRNGSTKVYIPLEGKDYAVVRSEAMGTMPVNFKAENNGSYTLSFTAEDVNFAYLHLIDNMNGNDVDLLANPSYTFEAKTTDYESRFKLVFAAGNSNDDNFAFYSNGSFVINNEGNATLQVIDVNGRILKSESINGCANVNVNAAQGIYMLRLVNGNDVKVQKVVVR